MGGKKSLMNELRRFKQRVEKAVGTSKIVLFGSRAEGKGGRYTDVDLIIVSEKFDGLNFIQRAALMYDYWKARLPVDFLCYTPKEFEGLRKRVTIVSHALEHGTSV